MRTPQLRLASLALFLLVPALALAQAAAPEAPAPAEDEKLRLRAGAGGGLGTFVPGPMISLGASGRVGAQLSDLAAVFLEIGNRSGFWLGLSVSGGNVSQSVSGLGYWHLGAMGELTLGDSFFVAGGPMFVRGGWGAVHQEVIDGNVAQYVVAAGGNFSPGLAARMGFGFGQRRSSTARSQLTVSVDCHLVFARVASVSQRAGPSGVSQSISVGDTTLGILPLLMVGYEWK